MSGHGNLKYFRPITHKMYTPEDKDPPEGKELPNLFAGFLSGFWSRGVEMRRNVLLGGQSYIIFLKAKHMTN